MSAKHTPGPWIVEYDKEGAWEVASPNGSRTNGYLVVCSRKAHHLMADQMNANARLIATAPELLEALQTIRGVILLQRDVIERGMQAKAWALPLEVIDAAIQKATAGESE
jgi:hypothetical protein